jgi:hypothetical protein
MEKEKETLFGKRVAAGIIHVRFLVFVQLSLPSRIDI